MKTEDIIKLGWLFENTFNNRNLYSLNNKYEYMIFEYNGSWGIINPYGKELDFEYLNMTDDQIVKYTELSKSIIEIYDDPKNHSFFEFCESVKKINDFINEMKKCE